MMMMMMMYPEKFVRDNVMIAPFYYTFGCHSASPLQHPGSARGCVDDVSVMRTGRL